MNTVSASSQKAEGLCMQTMSGDLSPAMQRPSALAIALCLLLLFGGCAAPAQR